MLAGVKEARFNCAGWHSRDLGNLGEGQSLDEEELCGDPVIRREQGEGLPYRDPVIVLRVGDAFDLGIIANVGAATLVAADRVGATPM